MTGARILIVDDEDDARRLLAMALRSPEYEIHEAADGLAALRLAHDLRPDLIVLDVAMPMMDGFLTVQRIREVWDTPVIMVTAFANVDSRVKGLNLGADDYITKPFDIDELRLRVESVLKRSRDMPYLERPARYSDDHLTVDLASRTVMVRGAPVALTPIEFGLLAQLVQHANQPVSSEDLVGAVWGNDSVPREEAEATLRVHLHHLRRKIEPDPRRPRYVRTERGIGYRFRVEA